MSKISDALDKADRERRKRKEAEETASPGIESPGQGQSRASGLPEAVRREMELMRNVVESQLPSRKFRSILFTSAASEEGVSTVTANFARTLAEDPAVNILVVDLNPHAPSQQDFFGVDNAAGFVEFARGDLKLESVLRSTARRNVCVIPSGSAGGGMLQLVSSERVSSFVADSRVRFNYLLFDAPPVLSYPETSVLGHRLDGVLLVVRALSTRREAVARAKDMLVKSGCNTLGIVLNRYRYPIPEFIYRRV